MDAFMKRRCGGKNLAELEKVNSPGSWLSGLMEFTRFILARSCRTNSGRVAAGSAFGGRESADHEADGGARTRRASYAPVDVLIDERPDGVHLSYDRMASLLAPYGNAEL